MMQMRGCLLALVLLAVLLGAQPAAASPEPPSRGGWLETEAWQGVLERADWSQPWLEFATGPMTFYCQPDVLCTAFSYNLRGGDDADVPVVRMWIDVTAFERCEGPMIAEVLGDHLKLTPTGPELDGGRAFSLIVRGERAAQWVAYEVAWPATGGTIWGPAPATPRAPAPPPADNPGRSRSYLPMIKVGR